MALKKKLTKEEFDKLSDTIKAEYVTDGDGFKLDVEGDEDTGALKRAKDREKELRQQAEADLKEAQAKLDALGSDDARKRGDIETLEKSWGKKVDETRAQYEARLNKLTAHTQKTMLEGTATAIASKISTVPSLMAKVIRERLTVDFEGDAPQLRVLDANGQPSAQTLEELQAEFVANKDYASIIVGSKASGGGASDSSKKLNGGAKQTNSDKPANLATMNPRELAEHIQAKSQQE